MQIQINTDKNIEGREELAAQVKGVVESALRRFSDRITRVEVHLSDQNSDKSGQDDKRCMMEARLEGRRPTAVTHVAATMDQAVDGAADKLKRSIESTLERLRDHHRSGSFAARERDDRGDEQREADDDLKRRGTERWDDDGGS